MGLRWKIYDATLKKTKQEVSIWLFDKKSLPKQLKNEKYYQLFRKEVERANKFKHPNIINIIKPLLESKKEMAFVTERVSYCLGNILGDCKNLDNNGIINNLKTYKFNELSLKISFTQLCETVLFIHNNVKMVHGFVNPCNIYITPNNDWKLFGFQFGEYYGGKKEIALNYDFTNINELFYLPSFQCLSPEILVSNILTNKSDTFSLGRVFYFCLRYMNGIRADTPILTPDVYRKFINALTLNQLTMGGTHNYSFIICYI